MIRFIGGIPEEIIHVFISRSLFFFLKPYPVRLLSRPKKTLKKDIPIIFFQN